MPRFKVLSIDGGGIKGLYSATILKLFEDELRKSHGDDTRIVDYADLICGTSTGGLIALALSLRIPAGEICDFYELNGPQIFRGSQRADKLLRQTLFGGKYSDEVLRASLESMFGDCTMGDSECLLCIPTCDFTHATYGVFKFDHKEGNLSRHNSLPMVDVGLSTSAAPTFFPLAQVPGEDDTQFVDGGLWANNPALVGLTEAIWHFVGPEKAYDSMNMLSVASLNHSSGRPPLMNRNRGFIRWAPDLFDLGIVAQSEFTDTLLDLLRRLQIVPMAYTRIPSADVSSGQAHLVKLDLATPESLKLMRQLAKDMFYKYRTNPEVESFFSERKTYSTRT